MADRTGIEWTESTWNPIVGCSLVSPGCTNCYAMRMADRIVRMNPGSHYGGTVKDTKAGAVWTGVMNLAPEHILTEPLRWRRPRYVFVNSMSDLFHEAVPDDLIDRVFAVMALAPQHTFQILTKRPGRMREYCSDGDTPHRVAKAIDKLTSAFGSVTEERVARISEFPGYFVTDHGRVLSDRGSGNCVHCGQPVERTARARYCSKRCRQNAQYRLRCGKPMLFPSSLAEMSPDVGEDGHRRVMLYRDGQPVRHLVHRLVLTAFERPAAPGEQGRHRDGDPSNNALTNLTWGDQSANWDDRKRHGAFRSYAKLTDRQAAEIRLRFQAGETGSALGREFGISDTQARNIGEGRQWAVAAPIPWPLANCWKGVSVEDQRRADERIPLLLDTPAAVRWVSAEPLLGPIDFTSISIGEKAGVVLGVDGEPDRPENFHAVRNALQDCNGAFERLDWIVAGGESGRSARPMHPDWPRSIRDQCAAAGVPFLFKQHGEWSPRRPAATNDLLDARKSVIIRPDGGITSGLMAYGPDAWVVDKVGKRASGRHLDGVLHDAYPQSGEIPFQP